MYHIGQEATFRLCDLAVHIAKHCPTSRVFKCDRLLKLAPRDASSHSRLATKGQCGSPSAFRVDKVVSVNAYKLQFAPGRCAQPVLDVSALKIYK